MSKTLKQVTTVKPIKRLSHFGKSKMDELLFSEAFQSYSSVIQIMDNDSMDNSKVKSN